MSTAPSGASSPSSLPFTEREFRDVLGQFATGVTIICARGEHGGFAGFTANSFNSLSLTPPLVLWSLDLRSTTRATFEFAQHYAINVLAHDQVALARRFSQPHEDRFAGMSYRLGEADAPLIEGCVAWLECRAYARRQIGDHMLFIGEVTRCERGPGKGLLFVHGGFAVPAPL